MSRTRPVIAGMRGARSKLTAALAAAALVSTLLSAGAAMGATPPAAASAASTGAAAAVSPRMAPGTPGTPSDPSQIYAEDFQNAPVAGATGIASYTSATGARYTADPVYQDATRCNGVIFGHQATDAALGEAEFCGTSSAWWSSARTIPAALGQYRAMTDANANLAVAEQTLGGYNDYTGVMLEGSDIAVPSGGRFVTFSLDVGNLCNIGIQALDRFYLLDGATPIPLNSSDYNICADPDRQTFTVDGQVVSVGTFTGNQAALVTSSSVGFRVVNQQPSGSGNDQAFDNFRILDVTPQLDKSFSPTSVYVDGSSTLTFTVTNTGELAGKDGWSFTDALPQGLSIAAQPNVGGDCDATITAAAGATSIAVADGSLAAGQVSCTITVDVTSATTGTYTNGPTNVETVGLNGPAASTVEFVEQPPFACVSNAPGLLFQSIPASMSSVDLVTGEYESDDAIFPRNINATGFNVLDGYIYGYTTTTEPYEMVRVGPDGAVEAIGPIPGVPGAFHIGDIDLEGHYWLSNGTTWYEVDMVPGSPTYRTVLDSGPVTGLAAGMGGGADWAFVPGGGDYLYGVFTDAAGTGVLYGFNTDTGAYESFGSLGVPISAVGAVYADADGFLYSSSNADGRIFRIDIQDVTATLFAQGPASGQNDGARCATSPILLDFGDAPDSYGTALASDGPRHGIQGMLPGGSTAPVMLGASVDAETNGAPSDAADGDDASDRNDEDGVRINPDLGYATDTLRTGLDPVSLQPIDNTLEVTASADGFVSAWVDWNQDGAFSDDERVANAQAVSAGVNTISFTQETNPAGIESYVRVRYSTDADAIATPTGAAPDGEVEDYRVLFERLVRPAVCAADDQPYFGFTFTDVAERGGSGGVGTYARFADVTVIDGVAIDMVAEVTAGNVNSSTSIRPSEGSQFGEDDIIFNILSSGATMRYSFYEADTTNLVEIRGVFTANDMDTSETATFAAADLAGYAVSEGSRVQITEEDGEVVFAGNGNNNADEPSRFQIVLEGISSFEARWAGFNGSGFGFDGDGDLTITPACSDFGDAPAGYATDIAGDGPRHQIVPGLALGELIDFDADGQASDDALGDDRNRAADEDGVADPIVVTVGDETRVTVSVTNTTAGAATLAGWIDLDRSGTFDAGELVTTPIAANTSAADHELTFPVGTTTADTFARFRLFPEGTAEIVPTGEAAGGEVEDYAVTVVERELAIEKTSTLTGESRPGDTVTYTVTATNTGTAPYTDEVPAVVFDDLSGVRDDGDYNADATVVASDGAAVPAPAFLSPSHVSWAGPLAAGASVEITYTVTLTGGGDGVVRNVAWVPTTPPPPGEVPPTPACDPATDEGADPVTGEPCASVESELPRLSVEKTSDVTDLPADGGVVTYEVTITNDGPGVYTEDAPATVTDDLSQVLDDGAFGEILSPETGAVFDEDAQELTWAGALGVDESVTIRYTVTYDQSSGDNILYNVACVPAGEAVPGAEPCAEVRLPGAELDVTKTVDPADGTTVTAGQEVTYTLSFASVGEAPAAVDKVDELSGVLDDATLVDGSVTVSHPGELTADLQGDELAVTGSVPVGQTYTVSYTVIVDAYADQGDHVLANIVQNADGSCDQEGCESTRNPIRHLSVDKSADDVTEVLPGDVVEYTVTVTSDGEGDYTAEDPATIVDDMTDVLDDAAYNGDAAAVASDGSIVPAPSLEDGVLGWAGPLAAGDSVMITYSVTVTNLGDSDLDNTAAVVCREGEICDPPTPRVEILLPKVTPSKTADPASGEVVVAGDVVTYTLSWTNDGRASGHVDSTDDLSRVLDDAQLTSLPEVDEEHAESVTAVFDAETRSIRVTGDLAPGETATVTYRVTVEADGERGDDVLANVAIPDVPPFVTDPDCEGDACPAPFEPPATEHRIPEIVDAKTVDPASSSSVTSGQVLTYTLTFSNEGAAAGAVDRVDDLTHVLDDADVTVAPATSGTALSVSEIADNRFAVTGTLQPEQTVTVTYAVTIKAPADMGDGQLANFLLGPNQQPPAEAICADGEDCTFNPVSDVTVDKTADPGDGAEVQQGQEIAYTLTFTNDGRGAATIDYTDHMDDVLDDADLTTAPVASDDALAVGDLVDGGFSVSGELSAGQTVTVAYAVTVREWGGQGDHSLGNVVAVTGQQPPAECVEDSGLCTRHPVAEPAAAGLPPLAPTGGDIATVVLLSGLGLLILGAGSFLLLRRRRTAEVTEAAEAAEDRS